MGKVASIGLKAGYEVLAAGDGTGFATPLATWPVNEHFTTELKYAGFSADGDRYTDTDKLWLTLQLKL